MEKVITNADILCEIFQYLNLKELLKLTTICPQFHTVIVDFVWRNRFKQLEICKTTQHFGLLLTNNAAKAGKETEIGCEWIEEEKSILNRRDVNVFLKLTANNIKRLVLYSPKVVEEKGVTTSGCFVYNPSEFGLVFDKNYSFVNLTSITFHRVIICDRDLRLLSECSKKLESLNLEKCFNISEKALVINDDIKIATLQKIRTLKCFKMFVLDAVEKDLSYDLTNILNSLNVKQLAIKVRNFSLIDQDDNRVERGNNRILCSSSNRCEELTIGYFRSQRIFRRFNSLILSNFKYLKKLVMESWTLISINEEFFKNLSKTCNSLENLQLKNFEMNGFAVVATLNTLMFENCSGLIWHDVKAMLSDMKLKSFSLLDTEYVGMFEPFNVAATLKHLLVIHCHRNHLKKLFECNNGGNLRNLTSLVWHNNYAEPPIYVATSCPKLRTLITEPSSLLINNLYDLACLENLTLRVGRKIKFSRMLIIFGHTKLKHFSLTKLEAADGYDEHNDYLIDYDILNHELSEFENRKLNLKFLSISLNNYFKIVQEFWFNLLSSNPKLALMIRYNRFFNKDHTFLKYIINHRMFPKRLTSVKICGYRIEIREFRENFETAVEKIKSFSNIYRDKEDNGYVLL